MSRMSPAPKSNASFCLLPHSVVASGEGKTPFFVIVSSAAPQSVKQSFFLASRKPFAIGEYVK